MLSLQNSDWNENWQGKPKKSEKTCPSVTLCTINSTWSHLGPNPGRRGGKPATKCMSFGTAQLRRPEAYVKFIFCIFPTRNETLSASSTRLVSFKTNSELQASPFTSVLLPTRVPLPSADKNTNHGLDAVSYWRTRFGTAKKENQAEEGGGHKNIRDDITNEMSCLTFIVDVKDVLICFHGISFVPKRIINLARTRLLRSELLKQNYHTTS
jgi:hypothetical protein